MKGYSTDNVQGRQTHAKLSSITSHGEMQIRNRLEYHYLLEGLKNFKTAIIFSADEVGKKLALPCMACVNKNEVNTLEHCLTTSLKEQHTFHTIWQLMPCIYARYMNLDL